MLEKSKSAITFEEFKKKLNQVNDFENDWGHFYDPDNNDNNIFQNNFYKPEIKKIEKKEKKEKKEEIKIKRETEIDEIDEIKIKVKREDIKIKVKSDYFIDPENPYYNEEDDKKIFIIATVAECVKKIFITFTMVYFVFKIM
jgi:hypothetical protein